MASWLIRIVSSSGKSIGKRRAICSGLHALAHRRFCRWPSRRFFQDTAGPVTGMPLGATTMPANLSSTYVRKVALRASLAGFGRRADRSACHWAVVARYSRPPLRVAALRRKLSGDRRRCPPELASDFLHGGALRAKERDLLALCKREISAGERLRRSCKHRWWHAACLPEPSCSDSLRHTGSDRSNLTRHAGRDGCPEPSPLISSCHWRSTWGQQWPPPRSIRSPLSNGHRNLLCHGVATTA